MSDKWKITWLDNTITFDYFMSKFRKKRYDELGVRYEKIA